MYMYMYMYNIHVHVHVFLLSICSDLVKVYVTYFQKGNFHTIFFIKSFHLIGRNSAILYRKPTKFGI